MSHIRYIYKNFRYEGDLVAIYGTKYPHVRHGVQSKRNKKIRGLIDEFRYHIRHTPKEQLIKELDECKSECGDGPTVEEYIDNLKTVFPKKKQN